MAIKKQFLKSKPVCKVTFSFNDKTADSVSVVGSFNNWDTEHTILKKLKNGIFKGTVDGSVDQHADQEINGVKVFKNTVSASVFWDTDAQSPCATLKDVGVRSVAGKTKNGMGQTCMYGVEGTLDLTQRYHRALITPTAR